MAKEKRVYVDENTMLISCDVSTGKGDEKVVLAEGLEHTLDFSNVTREEMLTLASATIVIKLQGIWRGLDSGAIKSEHGQVTDVHELINRPVTRGPIDPVAATLRAAERGDVDLEEVIAQLQAKLAKTK